jgi:hypothetical protein
MMKRRKLLLTLALVFAAFSFCLKANAQANGTVPIFLSYQNYYSYNRALFDIYLHDNNTGEWYNMWTDGNNKDEFGTYRCGYVPPGNYSVQLRLIAWNHDDGRYNWSAKNQSGSNVILNVIDFTEIISSIDINDDYLGNDYGLTIAVEDW